MGCKASSSRTQSLLVKKTNDKHDEKIEEVKIKLVTKKSKQPTPR